MRKSLPVLLLFFCTVLVSRGAFFFNNNTSFDYSVDAYESDGSLNEWGLPNYFIRYSTLLPAGSATDLDWSDLSDDKIYLFNISGGIPRDDGSLPVTSIPMRNFSSISIGLDSTGIPAITLFSPPFLGVSATQLDNIFDKYTVPILAIFIAASGLGSLVGGFYVGQRL